MKSKASKNDNILLSDKLSPRKSKKKVVELPGTQNEAKSQHTILKAKDCIKQNNRIMPKDTLCFPQITRKPEENLERELFNSQLKNLARQEMLPRRSRASEQQSGSLKEFEFIELFQKLHTEYRIEFDKELSQYYQNQTLLNKGIINDLETFDTVLPPQKIRQQ
ncbi:UNKNOWN [Stylonychia lemnae]|uniref:Uncharacterized protein n=1 Tax=Stylonychia lemnae TaxID=5949 RepID=A0A078AX51_STYLE|nr:UNKNOWN [Stylonychia lemnae]|eukprot:CDW86744.1 UNKNOWN [Stylonychia lemnae]